MHRTLIDIMRFAPLSLMYLLMSLAIPFYMVFNRRSCAAIYHYFRRRLCQKVVPACIHTWWNHVLFGTVVMDKFASYAGRRFKIVIDGNDIFTELSSGDSPFLMLSAHIGNNEVGGYSLSSPKRMNALVFGGESDTITNTRTGLLLNNNIRLIPVKDDMSHLITIAEAISSGEILSINADRVYGSPKTIKTRLLGADALLPAGPFALEAMNDIPAISFFTMKRSLHSYKIIIRRIETAAGEKDRNRRMALTAASYASRIEEALEEYPNQWFNYYEFWEDE